MSSDGENILNMMKQTRKFFGEISLLFRTIDDKMGDLNWDTSSTCISDGSSSISNPDQWIPICVFRFYLNKKQPNILPFISALLDDHWHRKYSINEPLLTAGYFNYGGVEVKDNYYYRYSRCFGYLSKNNNLITDGTSFKFESSMFSPLVLGKPEKIFQTGEVFAFPLIKIKNSEDAENVAKKLVDLIGIH